MWFYLYPTHYWNDYNSLTVSISLTWCICTTGSLYEKLFGVGIDSIWDSSSEYVLSNMSLQYVLANWLYTSIQELKF